VNRLNVSIWRTEQPHAQIEHQRDSPKLNVFSALSGEKMHDPFFFTEENFTGNSFLGIMENWLLPQLNINFGD
jgi:hypothetical protein